MRGARLSYRLVFFLSVAVVGACLSACGEDDSSPDTTTPTQTESQVEAGGERARTTTEELEQGEQAEPEPLSEEEAEAKRAADDFYAILGKDKGAAKPTTIDSASFCALMSEEAVRQTVDYVKVSSGLARKWDCRSAVEQLVLRAKRSGGLTSLQKAEVIAVNAEGDAATATVRFGDGPATSIPLLREDGEWKLGASGLGE
jgi:hypothetical protein